MLKIGSINSSALEKVTKFYQLSSQSNSKHCFSQEHGFLRGLQLEVHFGCLLINFPLHKKENGNYLMTCMDYLQIRMHIYGSNLFEEWLLLL